MVRVACLVVLLCVATAPAVPPSFLTTYRDGDTRPPRVMSSLILKRWVARHAASGDIDKRCDGICRVVVCECEPTPSDPEPLRMCGDGGDATVQVDGCGIQVLEIPVGSTRRWTHEMTSTTLACEAGRQRVCVPLVGP
jgi:hypothetical protein